jgi:hypothetical protein
LSHPQIYEFDVVVKCFEAEEYIEMTNLGLNFGVLREVSTWQRCLLREITLYIKNEE